jgi:exosortase H (IPTLxxWG-CTERM-specific)
MLAPGASVWMRRNREAMSFVAIFALAVIGFSLVLQFDWVTIHLVGPYTEGIASVAGFVLDRFGEQTAVSGTRLASSRFSVNIYHGCNGLLATSIYVAAVLAFPSTLRQKGIGVGIGIPAIQIINLVRIVALYYTGVFWPNFFAVAHGYVWQSIVILFTMLVWIYWAERFVRLRPPVAP